MRLLTTKRPRQQQDESQETETPGSSASGRGLFLLRIIGLAYVASFLMVKFDGNLVQKFQLRSAAQEISKRSSTDTAAATSSSGSVKLDEDPARTQQDQYDLQDERRSLSSNHVSTCVMVKDANHELIEWIAYHYHTLPLRRLIIFTDINATTTPDPIVQRWRGLINFSLWTDVDIWPNGLTRGIGDDQAFYVRRQQEFNSLCMKTLYEEGQRWITLHDPDEYLTINPRVFNESEHMYGLNLTSQSIDLPAPQEAGSTLKFIKSTIVYIRKFGTQNNKYLEPFETSCIGIHRKQFSNWGDSNATEALPGNNTTETDSLFPFDNTQGLLPSDLRTWRWHYWGGGLNIMGKALVDFARIDHKDIPSHPSIHLPIRQTEICRPPVAWRLEKDMPLIMNHYASTWEQALFQSADSRGGRQGRIDRYNQDQKYHKFYDDRPRIREWLAGFVESVGQEKALLLLQHAGNPKTANDGAFLLDPTNDKMHPAGARKTG